jgi:hypothetical protein
MTAIDYTTCGVTDVIAHSLKLRPRLLADCIRSHAGVHAEFADAYGDPEVARNELGLTDRLAFFADAIDLGDYTMPDDPDVRREAFSCAARLQDLHPIMQKAIAEREDARNARPMADDYEALEDKFPLRPARGVVIAVVIGTFIWLVVLVLGLRLFSPSVLLIASLVMLVAIALKSLLRVARRTAIARAKSRR